MVANRSVLFFLNGWVEFDAYEKGKMKEMETKPSVLIVAIALSMSFVGLADVRPAALLADQVVIQRETKAPVWGRADAKFISLDVEL